MAGAGSAGRTPLAAIEGTGDRLAFDVKLVIPVTMIRSQI
jgi:hypothetical protein